MYNQIYISVIIPIYNEVETIPELYQRLKIALTHFTTYQLIFVDDGSSDGSFNLLKEYALCDNAVTIIKFSRNFGHHCAMSAGLDYAVGEHVVMMDGDLQDEPEAIPLLYKKLQEGYDVVYAERKNNKFSFFKKTTSKLFLKLLKWLLHEKIEVSTTVFRIMRKKVVDQIIQLHERQRYLTGIIGWVGFKQTSLEIEHAQRKYGITKYPLFKQIKLALDAICSFSDYPLRLITYCGLLLMGLSVMLTGFLIAQSFLFGLTVTKWFLLLAVILFTSGIQLTCLGVLGEYVGRIYVEVKKRPLYVVDDLINPKNTQSNHDRSYMKEQY